MNLKIIKSNDVHKKLSKKHNDKANNTYCSTSINFWSLVKRDYHDSVIRDQNKFNKKLSINEKRALYNVAVKELVDYRKFVNEEYGLNRYIPKKYKK